MTDTKYYYRLGNDDPMTGFLWSGSITTDKPITRQQASAIIRKRNNIKRLPARTMIVSADMLKMNGRFFNEA